MQKFVLILFCMILFLGCRKNKLKGEYAMLEGKWKWVFTNYESDICNPPTNIEVRTPVTENKSVSIEFLHKGYVQFYLNNEKTEKKRIVFEQWKYSVHPNFANKTDAHKFGINLDNKSQFYIEGDVGGDTIMLYPGYFPEFFNGNCDGCCYHWSYFVRE